MSQLLTWVLQGSEQVMVSLPAHEKVVLVGHDLGGFPVSKAMENFPKKIVVAVFVTALMPGPTLNATTVYTEAFASTEVVSALDNRVTYDMDLPIHFPKSIYMSVIVTLEEDSIPTK